MRTPHNRINLYSIAALLWIPVAASTGCDGAHLNYGGSIDSPLLDESADITNQPAITLTGTAIAGAKVIVEGGSTPAETVADADGRFAVDVDLRLNAEQRLEVRQELDVRRSEPALADIEQDSIAPARPIVQWPSSPRRSPAIFVSGMTEADAHVMIAVEGGRTLEVVADGDGHFECGTELDIDLSVAVNVELEVWARDAAGNESAPAGNNVIFDPNATLVAPSLDPMDTYVNTPTVEVTGTADTDVIVVVRSPRGEERVRTEADGSFAAEVALALNTENLIRAHAEDPGTGEMSPASVLTLIHDDIAPGAPVLDPVADRTGMPTIRVTGSAEAEATVRFDGPAGDTDTRASGSGHFAVDLALEDSGSPTHFDAVAIDLAGNVSASVGLDVELDLDLGGTLTLDPFDRITSDPTLTLRGDASAGAVVTVMGGDGASGATAGSDGRFVVDVDLNLDIRNELHVMTDDGAEIYVSVIHDGTVPILDLDPLPDSTSSPTVRVSGDTEANAVIEILVNGHPDTMMSDGSGSFSGTIDLGVDAHVLIDIRVVDQAGNMSDWEHHEIDRTEDTVEPPTLSECPEITSERTIRLTGYAAAGLDIHVSGAARVATGIVDASGAFAVDVELAANVVNDLVIRAADGSTTSSPTNCSVEHDDVPPPAPACEFETLGLDLDVSICILRLGVDLRATACVEANAWVLIENLETGVQAWVQADAQGSVSTSIGMCTTDDLTILQVDAAGNASAAADLLLH